MNDLIRRCTVVKAMNDVYFLTMMIYIVSRSDIKDAS